MCSCSVCWVTWWRDPSRGNVFFKEPISHHQLFPRSTLPPFPPDRATQSESLDLLRSMPKDLFISPPGPLSRTFVLAKNIQYLLTIRRGRGEVKIFSSYQEPFLKQTQQGISKPRQLEIEIFVQHVGNLFDDNLNEMAWPNGGDSWSQEQPVCSSLL